MTVRTVFNLGNRKRRKWCNPHLNRDAISNHSYLLHSASPAREEEEEEEKEKEEEVGGGWGGE